MRNLTFKAAMLKGSQPTVNRQSTDGQSQRHCKQTPLSKRWKVLMTLVFLFTFAIGNVWAALTAHTPGVYEKATSQGGYGATLVTVSSRQYEVYGFSYNSSGSKPQILWAGTSTNNASDSHVLCSTLSTTPQEIAGWISMSTVSKSSTYSMPSGTEFAASSVGSTGLYQMKLQGHSITLIFKGYDQFSFLGNDNNGDKSKGKYLQVYINGADSTKDVSSSTTVRRWTLNPSTTYTIVITGLGSSNEHIDAFSLRLPACQAPTTAFSEGAYTVGESALALSSLIVENSNNSDGAISYVVKTDGGTGASIAAGSFTATTAGTATITATQAADATHNKCEKIIDFNVVVTASSCAATIPGDISKGALTAGEITLTADGSAESGDIWYWQDAADGTATNLGTGATKNINTAGMYYIRSYNTAGDCWSAAKSIEVTAEELLEHYAITYNKGAYGTGEIAGGEKVEGVAYTLSSDRFTRAGYVQVGWATTDGGAKAYDLGGSYTTDKAQEFFPVWAETSTYVASFDSGEECSASTPAGWTFANAGSYGATDATADFECKFGENFPTSAAEVVKNASYIAFAKAAGACATYDLGSATTVSALAGTFYVGSGSERTFTIEYLAANGTTVLHTISTTTNTNWGEKAVNDATVVPNVKYIRINPAHAGTSYSWLVMKAFSVTYVDLVTKYNVTFDKNDEGASGSQATLKYAEGAEVTLPATSTFTAPDDMEFDAWISDDVTISNNKFTMPNKAVTIKATWKSACALAPTVSATTLGTTSYTTQVVNCAGISVLGSAGCTISEYGFVYGTATAPTISDNKKALEGDYTVAGTAFAETTLTGLAANTKYYVRAYATNSFGTAYGEEISFTTLAPLGNVLVIAGSASQTSDAITAMRNAGFVVTVSAHDHERSYAGYDLVVLDESLGGSDAQTATNEESKIKDVNIPILNLKAFFYTKTNRWNWGSPVNGTGGNEIANIPTTYKNTQSHPIFEGLTITAGAIDLIDPAKSGNTLQGVTTNTLVEGKEGYTLATSGDGITFIHELTPAQRGVTDAKYLMIAFANNAKDNLSADGERLIVNAAKYLVGSTAWDPEYYTVSFEAHGDADPSPLTGKTITLPSATNGTESFLGWFTEATGGEKIGDAGESYTPSADITLHAQWEAVSSDARLASITFSAVGTLAPEFNPEVTSYTYTMPYGTAAIPTITGATSVNAKAQEPVIVQQAAAWNETAIIRGKAQSGDTKAYNVTMKMAPKDGVCLVWGDIPSDNTITYNATNSKVYKAEEVSLVTNVNGKDDPAPSGVKFQNNDYVKVALNEGTFKAGDILALDVTYGTANKMYVYKAQSAAAADIIGELDGTTTPAGLNKVAITEDAAALWLVRAGQSSSWNPHVDYVAVYRIMNPELMAITIDGRAGEIDALNDKHFNVTIPYEAVLTSLTVVPTIVRNAAHATTPEAVISNEGAWVLGDNTYRVMDKDGDYTDYTITLTRDVLKHAVKFYNGENVYATVEVVDGEQMAAGDVPADPEKEDYIFQGWAETADGTAVDVTSFTISAAKNFYAKWAADGAIKLLNGATVNHTNFITGVTADETVEFKGNEVHYAKFSGTVSGVNGVKDLTRVIAYNATTNKTKIQISAHNNSTSGRSILVKGLVEGASAAVDLATIDLGNKEDKVSEWIEFNNAANRTIYIMVSSSAGDVYFTQVKVIESGETEMKQVGEAGYSLNFNKGRFFGVKDLTAHFEGLDVEVASSDCAPLNTEVVKLNNTSMSFTVATPLTLTVTTNNNKTYYVTEGAAGMDNETAKTGATDFDLTAGTWYITGGASNVEITNIAFALPKCAKPAIETQPATKQTFGPGNLTATVVADDPSDGGTLKYQWYDAATNEEVENATEATLTTTTEGTYYVIVTNTLADHSDNSVKSDEATLGYRVTDDATLSVLKYGETAIALEDDKYDYRVDLAMGTIDVPELTATATMAPYPTVVITNATEFVNYEATSTVVVTAEDGVTTKTYTVKFVVDHIYTALVDVTGSTTWNWKNAAAEDVTIDDVANKGTIIANYLSGANFEKIEGKANEKAFRDQNDGVYQGTHLHFNTTVPGKVKFYFRAPSSGEECVITVINNGKEIRVDSTGNSLNWSREVVVYGDVVIEMENKKEGKTDTRVQTIVFTEDAPDYSRDVTNNIGTLCVDHNVLVGGAMGATFYQIASRNELYDYKIDFEEVLPNEELKAGEPYIFQSTTGKIELFYADGDAVTEPVVVRGMHGVLAAGSLEINEANKMDVYYIQDNKLRDCSNLSSLTLVVNRAYIVMSDVPTYAEYQEAQQSQQGNAPARRRVTLGKDAEQIATGFENINAGDKPMKIMIDGQIFILRGEKMYDATGRLVK